MDYSDRLQAAMTHAKKGRKALSSAIGVTEAAIGLVINRKTKALTAENNSKASAFLGVSADWLATGQGEMLSEGGSLAHAVRHQPFDHPLLTREQMMTMGGELPARFTYVLEDDAMGEHGRAGTEVIFQAAGAAKVGAGVLVRDKTGAMHVRRKAQGNSDSHWLGVPAKSMDQMYRTLDSEKDGLQILAVWRGVANRGLEDA